MKFWRLVFFGFVIYGTVTACADHGPLASQHEDSATSIVDGGKPGSPSDASALQDAEAPAPLIITPESPEMPRCTSPFAPVLEALPAGATLPVFANAADGLELGASSALAITPSNWAQKDGLSLPTEASEVAVFARLSASDCSNATGFFHAYSVRTTFAPAAELEGSTAVSKDDPRISAWATKILSVSYGSSVTASWQTPARALGPATLDTSDVVSLGEGGTIALGFDVPLTDGDGYDLAIFENGFADNYLELAYVEVSSDGLHFLRFDSANLVPAQVGAYGTLDPKQLEGLAGKYRVGYGTPFDLAWLKGRPEVQSGLVNLAEITAVRVVDIVGDGRNRDSFGHSIFDPYPTVGGAGFDLDAIGLLNTTR